MYFPTTLWSLLAHASLNGETAARNGLEELCRRYWLPLQQFIRSRGYNEVEAQDLTQEFLLHLLEHSCRETGFSRQRLSEARDAVTRRAHRHTKAIWP